MKKYSKDLNDGKLMKCICCNAIYSPLCMERHYKTDYHLEQLCQKEYGMSAEKFMNLVCEEKIIIVQ